jgi:hypothetical protein
VSGLHAKTSSFFLPIRGVLIEIYFQRGYINFRPYIIFQYCQKSIYNSLSREVLVAWHARARIPVSSQDNPLLQWVKIYGAKRVHKDAKAKKVRVVGARRTAPNAEFASFHLRITNTTRRFYYIRERRRARRVHLCTFLVSRRGRALFIARKKRSKKKFSFATLANSPRSLYLCARASTHKMQQ